MSWTTREGKYAEKLVEVVSVRDVREWASTGVADGSSARSSDVVVVSSTDVESGAGSTDVRSGAGVDGREHSWPGPMKLATGTATASSKEDGGGMVVGSPRLMVDKDKDGDGRSQSLKEVRPSSTIYPANLMGITY
jgi:hypothetical protein